VGQRFIVEQQREVWLRGEGGKVGALLRISDIDETLQRQRAVRLVIDGKDESNNRCSRMRIELLAQMHRHITAYTLNIWARYLHHKGRPLISSLGDTGVLLVFEECCELFG